MRMLDPMFLRPLLLACLLAAWPPATAMPGNKPPAVMLPVVLDGEIDVAQYLVSEKLDGVRGRWDGRQLWTRGGLPVSAPAWFTAGWPAIPMDGELWKIGGASCRERVVQYV